jgi:YbbR domain-containing protein
MAFKHIDRLLSSKIFLRGVAFVVALLMWFYVAGDRGYEVNRTLRLKVNYQNASPGFTILRSEGEVQVRIAANRKIFESLDLDRMDCSVDLKGLESGKYRLPVRVLLPPGVRLVSVVPEQVTVELSRLIEKVLPAKIVWEGEFPEDVLVDKLEMTPSEVTLRGPEKVLAGLNEAVVQVSPASVLAGDEISREVRLISEKGATLPKGVDLYPKEIRIKASLVKDVEKKELQVVPNVSGVPEAGYRVEEATALPATVQVVGAKSVLETLDRLQTKPIDVTGLAQDKTFETEPELPEAKVKVLGPGKIKVSVVVRPVDNGTGSLRLKIPVKVEGKSVYPSWKAVPPSVAVQIVSESGNNAFQNLSEPLVEVYVDVTNLVSKRIVVPVQVRLLSKDVRVLKVEPERVILYAVNP